MPQPKGFYFALIALLVILNLGNYLLQDIPDNTTRKPLAISKRILDYQGTDLPLNKGELAILAPAQVLSRRYESQGKEKIIWMNMLEATSIGSLHNFFDSLVASGTKPLILGDLAIATEKGPLRTTLIRYSNPQGKLFYLLLWYQWDDGNAANRWQWYQEILKLRLQRKKPAWRLTEIATPKTTDATIPKQSPDVQRLIQFAKALYEHPEAFPEKE